MSPTAATDASNVLWVKVDQSGPEGEADARPPKAGRSAQIQQIVADELELLRKFNPHEPRDPDGKWSLVGAAKKLLGKAKEAEAPEEIDAPKVHVPETPAHVLASRHDYGERIAKAAKGDTALDATPGKFSYDFKPGEDYRGKGQLKGIKGGGSPAALEAYQSTGTYKTMNEKLRGIPSDPELSAKDKEFIDGLVGEIDKTMRASRLDDDVVVHRVVAEGSEIFGPVWGTGGMDIGPQDFAKVKQLQDQWKSGWRPDMTGMQFTDHGFVSASAHPEWPKRYASHMQGPSNEPVMFRILVPKGTGGVQLSEAGEAEILLERGLSFEVVQDHGVGSDGLRRLDLRVVEAA